MASGKAIKTTISTTDRAPKSGPMEPSQQLVARVFPASTETALCLIPPRHLWHRVNRLRSLYDKAYNKWPPHINLIYPFVQPECLANAVQVIGQLDLASVIEPESSVRLEKPDTFNHRHHSTLYIRPQPGEQTDALVRLVNFLRKALGREPDEKYQPHLTIAQSDDTLSAAYRFLLEKVRLLTPFSWDVAELVVLIRDNGFSENASKMKLWGWVSLGQQATPTRLPAPHTIWEPENGDRTLVASATPQTAYHFVPSDYSWRPFASTDLSNPPAEDINRLIVASYNVLAEFEWPPSSERYPTLVEHISSERAAADILVLEEVTDQFLTFLLADAGICSRYPYSTHGPPNQPEIGPLPSLLNIVVMSRFPLQWDHLLFQRRHKSASVVTFPTLTTCGSAEAASLPVVVVACHLSQGLTDGSVATKKTEMQKILKHLSDNFEGHPWIVSGDFNVPTSLHTMDMARERQVISPQSYQYLRNFDSMLSDYGLQDTWLASKVLYGDSSSQAWGQWPMGEEHEGEQGATFNPLTNKLAAKAVGGGLNNRPQRYDRILVNNRLRLRPCRFNMFGSTPTDTDNRTSLADASDHWGIRCLLERSASVGEEGDRVTQGGLVQLRRASSTLGGLAEIKECLALGACLPKDSDAQERTQAMDLLKRTLQCQGAMPSDANNNKDLDLVLVPVGSFGLGVWTPSSDVDCLCIGRISTRTFFSIATSRLRRAAPDGITILRRVRANSGTMLELDINGIKFDLQYCKAVSILNHGFPDVMRRPDSDPVFALGSQTLLKLKPLRDLWYLQRSIPDMAQYRVAHLLIKAWAKSRGLYGAKFGLLGGIHISVLLVPICKTLVHEGGSVTVADILASFFHHYSRFDWKQHAVLDPFFHKNLKYHRSFREPLCLLGWHVPSLNTALNASAPTVKTLAVEFHRADSLLSRGDISWNQFLDPGSVNWPADPLGTGVADFLQAHRSYVRINAYYWGSSPRTRARFIGWLESRCVMLLVDLDRKVPALASRVWPQRFAEESALSEPEPSSEFQGFYLIGLDWQENSSGRLLGEDVKITEGALRATLHQFEMRMRGDEKYFDTNCCWLSAELVRRSELGVVHLDYRHLEDRSGEHGISEDDDLSSEDELQGETEGGDGEETQRMEEQHRRGPTETGDDVLGPEKSHHTIARTIRSAPGKFRTARDVMNRLRWDPNLDNSDYIVGYEDRFVGTREKLLELWKNEQTDEEFIPQHRILYFRRRSDNVIVWERKTRLDNVFGSGIPKVDSRL